MSRATITDLAQGTPFHFLTPREVRPCYKSVPSHRRDSLARTFPIDYPERRLPALERVQEYRMPDPTPGVG
jgi:hypothetical protein